MPRFRPKTMLHANLREQKQPEIQPGFSASPISADQSRPHCRRGTGGGGSNMIDNPRGGVAAARANGIGVQAQSRAENGPPEPINGGRRARPTRAVARGGHPAHFCWSRPPVSRERDDPSAPLTAPPLPPPPPPRSGPDPSAAREQQGRQVPAGSLRAVRCASLPRQRPFRGRGPQRSPGGDAAPAARGNGRPGRRRGRRRRHGRGGSVGGRPAVTDPAARGEMGAAASRATTTTTTRSSRRRRRAPAAAGHGRGEGASP